MGVRIPKLLASAASTRVEALRGLPLTPVDGFILSRIDGRTNETEIADQAGLDLATVRASLEKLARLGVASLLDGAGATPGGAPPASPSQAEPSRAEPSRAPPPASPSDGARAAAPKLSTPSPASPAPPAPRPTPDDGVDLDGEHRAAIEATFARLDALDHYALLGAPRDADKKTIKRAYYEFASRYHPDRFFRKNLGVYRAQMEAIFARGTAAHDALTSKARRAEYDAELGAAPASDPPPLAASALAGEAAAPAPDRPDPTPTPEPADASPSARTPLDPRARRDALARRLLAGRTSRPPPPPGGVAAPSIPPLSPGVRGVALAPGAPLIAPLIAPQIAPLIAPVSSAARGGAGGSPGPAPSTTTAAGAPPPPRASASQIEQLRRRAILEEENGRWAEAAAAWERVAATVPDEASALERIARALVNARGDLERATGLALRAVALAPGRAAYRTTLATIYLARGRHREARTELVAAQRLAPTDDTIRELLKRVP